MAELDRSRGFWKSVDAWAYRHFVPAVVVAFVGAIYDRDYAPPPATGRRVRAGGTANRS